MSEGGCRSQFRAIPASVGVSGLQSTTCTEAQLLRKMYPHVTLLHCGPVCLRCRDLLWVRGKLESWAGHCVLTEEEEAASVSGAEAVGLFLGREWQRSPKLLLWKRVEDKSQGPHRTGFLLCKDLRPNKDTGILGSLAWQGRPFLKAHHGYL